MGRDLVECSTRSGFVVGTAVVQSSGEPFVLGPRPGRLREKAPEPFGPRVRVRLELEPVVAYVHKLRDADHALRILACSPAHTRDERVTRVQSPQLLLRLRWNSGVFRSWHD